MNSDPPDRRNGNWEKSTLPREARPVLYAMIASLLWFLVFSPIITAPWGVSLDSHVVDSGVAKVSSCRQDWWTAGRIHICQAHIQWVNNGVTSDLEVLSHRYLAAGEHEVVAHHESDDASIYPDNSFSEVVAVPADMPTFTGRTLLKLMLVNITAIAVIWGIAIKMIFLLSRPTR